MMGLFRILPLLLGALVLSEPPTSTVTAGAATTTLPGGVKPLPDELAQRLQELTRAAEQARGLRSKQAVASGVVEPAEVKTKMAESLREDLPPERFAAYEASLEAFGLIPEDLDLARYLPELLASQVVGFYDPRREYLAIVRQPEGALEKALGPERGAELAGTFENLVLVHEIVHALQDQHFDLEKYAGGEPLSDEAMARQAVVEGDATLAMFNYLLGGHVEAIPGLESGVRDLMRNPAGLAELSAGMPAGQGLTEAPAWLRDTLLFSYLQGALFCMDVKKAGGQALVDRAFTQDPPRSTEQILHPEKWHGKREDPVEIRWPDLGTALPGYRKVAEGQLGELGVQILLRQGGVETRTAAQAAAGWGGDRFALYEKEGRRVLAWITEWDSKADARELRDAFPGAGLGGWRLESPAESRVVAIRGTLSEKEREALVARLASAEARRPPGNKVSGRP